MTHQTALLISAGLSLKPDHYRAALETDVNELWFEVHPENYMVAGGPRLAWLEAIRKKRALSFHGVGASLGGLGPLDADHMKALKSLIERFEPEQVSEHATFSSHQGQYHADLLPLPRTEESIAHLASRVGAFQDAVQRRILIENPTNYLDFASECDEPDFLMEVAKRSGCGLLIDLNNIWVSSHNLAIDPYDYIKRIDPNLVGEIHIAGHSVDPILGASFLIDSHDAPVKSTVFHLLKFALNLWGPKPTLIERDGNIPEFDTLLDELAKAQALIDASKLEHYDAA
ncbi:MAG: MNIO family bufferin maturase [Alphaproteobacteria bacterium]